MRPDFLGRQSLWYMLCCNVIFLLFLIENRVFSNRISRAPLNTQIYLPLWLPWLWGRSGRCRPDGGSSSCPPRRWTGSPWPDRPRSKKHCAVFQQRICFNEPLCPSVRLRGKVNSLVPKLKNWMAYISVLQVLPHVFFFWKIRDFISFCPSHSSSSTVLWTGCTCFFYSRGSLQFNWFV